MVVGDPNQQISMEALSLVEGQEEPGHQQRPVLPAGQLVHLLLFWASGVHLRLLGAACVKFGALANNMFVEDQLCSAKGLN